MILKKSINKITPPLSPTTINLLITINQNHQLTQLIIQLQKIPKLHKTKILTTYNNKHINIINTIFNTLPTLFNTFKFDKKNIKPLLLTNNSNKYPNLFSTIQHKQQNIIKTIYLTLSNHTHLFKFTTKNIINF